MSTAESSKSGGGDLLTSVSSQNCLGVDAPLESLTVDLEAKSAEDTTKLLADMKSRLSVLMETLRTTNEALLDAQKTITVLQQERVEGCVKGEIASAIAVARLAWEKEILLPQQTCCDGNSLKPTPLPVFFQENATPELSPALVHQHNTASISTAAGVMMTTSAQRQQPSNPNNYSTLSASQKKLGSVSKIGPSSRRGRSLRVSSLSSSLAVPSNLHQGGVGSAATRRLRGSSTAIGIPTTGIVSFIPPAASSSSSSRDTSKVVLGSQDMAQTRNPHAPPEMVIDKDLIDVLFIEGGYPPSVEVSGLGLGEEMSTTKFEGLSVSATTNHKLENSAPTWGAPSIHEQHQQQEQESLVDENTICAHQAAELSRGMLESSSDHPLPQRAARGDDSIGIISPLQSLHSAAIVFTVEPVEHMEGKKGEEQKVDVTLSRTEENTSIAFLECTPRDNSPADETAAAAAAASQSSTMIAPTITDFSFIIAPVLTHEDLGISSMANIPQPNSTLFSSSSSSSSCSSEFQVPSLMCDTTSMSSASNPASLISLGGYSNSAASSLLHSGQGFPPPCPPSSSLSPQLIITNASSITRPFQFSHTEAGETGFKSGLAGSALSLGSMESQIHAAPPAISLIHQEHSLTPPPAAIQQQQKSPAAEVGVVIEIALDTTCDRMQLDAQYNIEHPPPVIIGERVDESNIEKEAVRPSEKTTLGKKKKTVTILSPAASTIPFSSTAAEAHTSERGGPLFPKSEVPSGLREMSSNHHHVFAATTNKSGSKRKLDEGNETDKSKPVKLSVPLRYSSPFPFLSHHPPQPTNHLPFFRAGGAGRVRVVDQQSAGQAGRKGAAATAGRVSASSGRLPQNNFSSKRGSIPTGK